MRNSSSHSKRNLRHRSSRFNSNQLRQRPLLQPVQGDAEVDLFTSDLAILVIVRQEVVAANASDRLDAVDKEKVEAQEVVMRVKC